MANYSLVGKQKKENDHFVIFLSFGFFGIVLNILLCQGGGMRLKFRTRKPAFFLLSLQDLSGLLITHFYFCSVPEEGRAGGSMQTCSVDTESRIRALEAFREPDESRDGVIEKLSTM